MKHSVLRTGLSVLLLLAINIFLLLVGMVMDVTPNIWSLPRCSIP